MTEIAKEFQGFCRQRVEPLLADDVLQKILRQAPVKNLANDEQTDPREAWEVFVEEGTLTLDLVQDHIDRQPLLEIGGGIGLVHAYLKARGIQTVSLEPGEAGHIGYHQFGQQLLHKLGLGTSGWVDAKIESWTSQQQFGCVFSNNVLEHVENLGAAFASMKLLLRPNGVMIHNCPNYLFPYEPHLGLPVLSIAPGLTALLFPRAKRDPIWEGLNFVTAPRVKSLSRANGFQVKFQKEVFYQALNRLGSDEGFTARHPVAARLKRILRPVLGLARWLPPALASPMIFEMRHA